MALVATTKPAKKTLVKAKNKKKTSAPKEKAPKFLLEYGDPQLRLSIRLLPPSLDKPGFIQQIEKGLEKKLLKSSTVCYHKGKASTKPFEEPVFSIASIQFPTRDETKKARKLLENALFTEPGTGDEIKCEVRNSIFQNLVDLRENIREEQTTLTHPLFKRFAELRAQNSSSVSLADLLLEDKSEAKKGVKTKVSEKKTVKKTTAELQPKASHGSTLTEPAVTEKKKKKNLAKKPKPVASVLDSELSKPAPAGDSAAVKPAGKKRAKKPKNSAAKEKIKINKGELTS